MLLCHPLFSHRRRDHRRARCSNLYHHNHGFCLHNGHLLDGRRNDPDLHIDDPRSGLGGRHNDPGLHIDDPRSGLGGRRNDLDLRIDDPRSGLGQIRLHDPGHHYNDLHTDDHRTDLGLHDHDHDLHRTYRHIDDCRIFLGHNHRGHFV